MAKRFNFSWLLCMALAAHPLMAQDSAATLEKAVVARMKTDIFYLAGPECEGRGIETEGINKAADFIAKSFRQAGLKSAVPDGSYFQPFKIAGRSTLGEGNTLKLTGPDKQDLPVKQDETFTVSGLSVGAQIKTKGIAFVGYGITKDKDYDDYAGIDVEGKAVVVMRRMPRYEAKDSPFSREAHAPLVAKAENAEKHKAALLIFVNSTESGGDGDDLMPYNLNRGSGSSSLPVVHVKRSVVDAMLKTVTDKPLATIEAEIEKDLKPRSIDLKGWTAEAETKINRKDLAAKNVVGVLEGAGPLANETVVIGAHYDHLGRGEPGAMSASKEVHYGADDNASGTTGVIELARRFGAIKDRQGRRMVFMTFSGEERGLLGSVHYCKHPLFPIKDTAAMINMDMIGRYSGIDGKNKLEIGGVGTAKEFNGLIDRLNKKYQFPISKTQTGNGPSDHESFNQVKVPVFFFFTGLHGEYHRPTDKPELINLEGMKKVTDMVEELAKILTTEPEKPVYINVPGSFNPFGSNRGPSIGLIPGAGAYDESAEGGVPVGGAKKDSPAEKAGLKEGDTIVEVAGVPVKNITAYMNQMAKLKIGEGVELTVLRAGMKVTLKVVRPK